MCKPAQGKPSLQRFARFSGFQHFLKMQEALAKSLGVPAEKIHLKAKTNEGVDAVGRGEAIACHVAATLVAF